MTTSVIAPPRLDQAALPAGGAAPWPAGTPVHRQPAGKLFDIDCQLHYSLPQDVNFLFQLHALDGGDQTVQHEALQIEPAHGSHVYCDERVGHRFLRLQGKAGELKLRYRARVRRHPLPVDPALKEASIAQIPDTVIHNLMPTRYCESDLLGRAAMQLFGGLPPGLSRVQAISDWIHHNIAYEIGSTDSTTTAREVFVQRAGVCRDFAHLGVSFCRALNIPARLVVGYAIFDEPPPDFHAIFEAYLIGPDGDPASGRWVMFDPTRMSPEEDLVRIAMGRDAKDVAFATIFGAANMLAMNPMITPVDSSVAA